MKLTAEPKWSKEEYIKGVLKRNSAFEIISSYEEIWILLEKPLRKQTCFEFSSRRNIYPGYQKEYESNN